MTLTVKSDYFLHFVPGKTLNETSEYLLSVNTYY